jgi:hypothetical protein
MYEQRHPSLELVNALPEEGGSLILCNSDTHYLSRQYVTLTVCLCVLSGSENKQRLFPYTTLTDWFL